MMLFILLAVLGDEPPNPILKLGRPAPMVDALFADGNPFNQEELKGKFVLITWWTAGDETTKKHFAAMRALRKEFVSEKRLQMISVCIGGEWDDWLEFQEKQPPLDPKLPLQRFYSDFKWWQAFHHPVSKSNRNPFRVGKKPASFLVGPDGKLAAVNIPDAKLRETIAKALGK